ncbi:MAG: NADH-quinone oxidoreductase subunit NuoG [Fimbriimonadaceae bacterium]|nr:NADH-quinone oxidoreductase subunit NuoG [Fimbriimonadaceae bacterium]
MAAAPTTTTETVSITINDIEIQVPKGELIVEAVKRLGLEIPIFCYHSRMKPVGMCRMCLVEVGFKQPDGSVRKMPKPQAGCTLPASDGMAIYTDTEMVHRDRKGVLEFLLVNHPLDCPICDRGGECPLQNNTLFYGPSTSRFLEMKRHLPKAFPLSQYVTLDLERCIQCGRCVRFTEEISGDAQLAFRFRGANMQPTSFQLTQFESKFSGNVIEVCPVGALTSSKYRFRARPWDLETKPAICTLCSNGCNIWFDHRAGKFVRVNGRTNEAVNEEWTCDKGKFGHDFYNSDKRLTHPLIREGLGFRRANWAEAYQSILEAFSVGGSKVAALVGPMVSNEGLYMLQKMFRIVFKSNNLDHRWTKHVGPIPGKPMPIADLESKQSILVFGTSLADEEPIVFLRVRKAWFNHGTRVVVASDVPTDVDSFAHLILRYNPGTELTLAKSLEAAAGKGSEEFAPEQTEGQTGVPAAKVREAALLLDPSGVIITAHGLLNSEAGSDTLNTLAALADSTNAAFSCYALGANDTGASEIGVLPDRLPGGRTADELSAWMADIPTENGLSTTKILEACASGQITALWLVGCDPLTMHSNRELVESALEGVDYLVVQDILDTEATGYASMVLPMEAPAEHDGSYTNAERRVQRIKPVIPAPGDAKPAWRIFAEAMLRANPHAPFFNAGEVMDELGKVVPAFAEARFENLDGEGIVLS